MTKRNHAIVNCSPKVRQYDILNNERGANFCPKVYPKENAELPHSHSFADLIDETLPFTVPGKSIPGTIPLYPGRFPQIVHSRCIFAETAGVLLKKCPDLVEE